MVTFVTDERQTLIISSTPLTVPTQIMFSVAYSKDGFVGIGYLTETETKNGVDDKTIITTVTLPDGTTESFNVTTLYNEASGKHGFFTFTYAPDPVQLGKHVFTTVFAGDPNHDPSQKTVEASTSAFPLALILLVGALTSTLIVALVWTSQS